MESVGSPDQPITAWEYGPDDLDLGRAARATVATTTATTSGQAINTPRIRVSAMSELKEFAGKDGDEDRARSWLGKVKSAFIRDQAPDQENCMVFGDLLTGPARNWYHQLSGATHSPWKDLHQRFQVQYCGRGVSVARQYYHARKRSDESHLEYLHRLNVAGLSTRLQIGSPDVRREHVEHFIETLDDRDLADQLALLRIPDAHTLEKSCDLASVQSQDRAKRCMYRSSLARSRLLQQREHGRFELFMYPRTAVTPTKNQGANQTKTYDGCILLQGRSKINPKINVSEIKPKSHTSKIATSANTLDRQTKGRRVSDARTVDLGSTTILGAGGV
ncbi:unnamed protein product [Phytophthora fragariaefolia]|uniref:Unnamed protein product n=1 Tax=Phytophthora fragariaefolia TaxID=1490495 RepID=A0A9W7CSI1_9STRA|nr:unnamed protein product [Phytophthora fragariaefolia]